MQLLKILRRSILFLALSWVIAFRVQAQEITPHPISLQNMDVLSTQIMPAIASHLQQETPTPAPPKGGSLFLNDTCAPPCWFGLTPGISTAQDVAEFARLADEDVLCCWSMGAFFEPKTDYILGGHYSFYWRDYSRPDTETLIQINSYILIDDVVVSYIAPTMNQTVPLSEVLENYGRPDQVFFAIELYGSPNLVLDYRSIPLRVEMRGPETPCNLQNLTESVWVDVVFYYSPQYLEENGWEMEFNVPYVPVEVWESWLNKEVNAPCYETYVALIEQAAPTPTPDEP